MKVYFVLKERNGDTWDTLANSSEACLDNAKFNWSCLSDYDKKHSRISACYADIAPEYKSNDISDMMDAIATAGWNELWSSDVLDE